MTSHEEQILKLNAIAAYIHAVQSGKTKEFWELYRTLFKET